MEGCLLDPHLAGLVEHVFADFFVMSIILLDFWFFYTKVRFLKKFGKFVDLP